MGSLREQYAIEVAKIDSVIYQKLIKALESNPREEKIDGLDANVEVSIEVYDYAKILNNTKLTEEEKQDKIKNWIKSAKLMCIVEILYIIS